MIALLTGEIALRNTDTVIVDVNGVGYRVQIPLSTYYALPEQGKTSLHIHTHVKEDSLQLFGFLSAEEKDFFALLISVSGVGPKLAITILSHMTAVELATALIEGDIPKLTDIPGIGKKSAERLILELQDKATQFATERFPQVSRGQGNAPSHLEDAISALINLGYKENFAKRAVKGINLREDAELEEILKQALQILKK